MRDIKFRAWRKGQNVMLVPHKLTDLFSYGTLENPDNVVWMQYTGLKDKNGVEIYEGDILNTEKGMFALTVSEGFLVELLRGDRAYCGDDYYEGNFSDSWSFNEFEVIGNIHENPELVG